MVATESALSAYWQYVFFEFERLNAIHYDFSQVSCLNLSASELKAGQIKADKAQALLGTQASCDVYLMPYRAHLDNDTIVPLWLRATLQSDGSLQRSAMATYPHIPLTLLQPMSAHGVCIGQQAIYERCLFGQSGQNLTWTDFVNQSLEMLETVSHKQWRQILKEADYIIEKEMLMIAADKLPHPITTQATLWQQKPTGLLPKLAETATPKNYYDRAALIKMGQTHVAQPTPQPLDCHQRRALLHVLDLDVGDIQTVQYAPHTGKAVWTQALMASHWVNAALAGKEPPLMLLTSTQKPWWQQEWRNIIDSNQLMTQPWLTDGLQPLACLGDKPSVPSEEVLAAQTRLFLNQASEALGTEVTDLNEAIRQIHEKLRDKHQALIEGLTRGERFVAVRESVETDYAAEGGADNSLLSLQAKDQDYEAQLEALTDILYFWRQGIAQTQGWRKLVDWATHNRAKLKEALKVRLTEKGALATDWMKYLKLPVEEIDAALTAEVGRIRVARAQLHKTLIPLCEKIANRSKHELQWLSWQKQHGEVAVGPHPSDTQTADATDLLSYFLDTKLRFQLFWWAWHYWEARWLKSIASVDTLKPEAQYRIHAMRQIGFLADPIIDASQLSADLIFDVWLADHAQSMSPMSARPWLAHARQAIAMGDPLRHTLSNPILSLADEPLCYHFGLAECEEDIEDLGFEGCLASTATWYQLAQYHNTFQAEGFTVQGIDAPLALKHNHATHPDIVCYLKSAGYEGQLISKRPEKKDWAFAPMSYLHIKGEVTTVHGCPANQPEARQIVLWLQANKQAFVRGTDSPVCVVTPFGAQKALLQSYLAEADLSTIPVLTLTECQGYRRPVVLFSPVYNALSVRPFVFDQGAHWLNMAIQTADDAFIVMGDMEAFDPSVNTPSGRLAQLLFASDDRRLPHHQLLARQGLPVKTRALDTEPFFSFTLDTLQSAQERAVLVTGLATQAYLSDERFIETCQTLSARGVEVVLYISDRRYAGWGDQSVQKALQRLIQAGTFVRILRNQHSHMLWVDEQRYCETTTAWCGFSPENPTPGQRYINIYEDAAAQALIQKSLLDLNARTTRRLKGRSVRQDVVDA